jgi:hypothetical protein
MCRKQQWRWKPKKLSWNQWSSSEQEDEIEEKAMKLWCVSHDAWKKKPHKLCRCCIHFIFRLKRSQKEVIQRKKKGGKMTILGKKIDMCFTYIQEGSIDRLFSYT